jgi:uncharacterized membrane protein (Fun14 family)
MPEEIRFAAKIVLMLYGCCVMVILWMNKVGHLTARMSHTQYTPESGKNIQGWSRRTKVVHLAIILAAIAVAGWPD